MRDRRQRATSSTDDGQKKKERSRSLSLYVEDTVRDVRLSFRTLARNPGFTIVAIVTLALGIGVNTAVFTLVDTLGFRPLPVPNPRQIVSLGSAIRGRQDSHNQGFPFPVYLTIREANQAFSGLIAWSLFSVHLSADGFTERLNGEMVSANFTEVLGIEPSVGRGFLPEEGQTPGRHPVAMISDRLWRERFHRSREVVGKTVKVNGHPFTLIGVVPKRFKGFSGGSADVWVPMMMQPQVWPPNRLDNPNYSWLSMIGRLKPDMTLESAQSSLAAIVSQLALEDPGWKNKILRLGPNHRGTIGRNEQSQIQLTGIILGAIMGSVLLIACTNVANLLLSRAKGRRLEMAIRLAAGASRQRLARYLLTETAVLFLAGGAAAILVGPWFMAMVSLFSVPSHLLRLDLLNVGLDLDNRTLLFTLFLTLTTAIVFGLVPAVQSSRIDLFSELKSTERYGRFRSGRWRHFLVILQVALSFTLLVVAGLSIRTLGNRLALDPGFEPANVSTLSVDMATQGYDETRGALFLRQLLRRVETAPSVESATLAQFAPAANRSAGANVGLNSRERGVAVEVNSIGPKYFETVRMPLIRGRDFRWTDDQDFQPVAIISQPVAERLWPNADPIGKQIFSGSGSWEVVGVAGKIQYRRLGGGQKPYVYFSLLQRYQGSFTLMARSRQQTSETVATMRRAVRELDPDLPTYGPSSLSDTIAENVAPWLFVNFLFGACGLLALTLASVGLYGVLSHSVIRRTREIAVRLAMGARRGHTAWLILKRAMVLVVIGLSIGVGAAIGLSRLIGHFVSDLDALDPVTYLVASLVVVAASLLASWVPAYGIIRLEPMEALRHE